jgi:hypothetical protein
LSAGRSGRFQQEGVAKAAKPATHKRARCCPNPSSGLGPAARLLRAQPTMCQDAQRAGAVARRHHHPDGCARGQRSGPPRELKAGCVGSCLRQRQEASAFAKGGGVIHAGSKRHVAPAHRHPLRLAPPFFPLLGPSGHLDGSLCLWDMRQDRAGGKALAEVGLTSGAVHSRRNGGQPEVVAERPCPRGPHVDFMAEGNRETRSEGALAKPSSPLTLLLPPLFPLPLPHPPPPLHPAAQLRDSAQTVVSLSPSWSDDSVVLSASKDSTLRLWDFRALSIVQAGTARGAVGAEGP